MRSDPAIFVGVGVLIIGVTSIILGFTTEETVTLFGKNFDHRTLYLMGGILSVVGILGLLSYFARKWQ